MIMLCNVELIKFFLFILRGENRGTIRFKFFLMKFILSNLETMLNSACQLILQKSRFIFGVYI